jgi:ABC-type uncharacterized transport system substrate-binding protein
LGSSCSHRLTGRRTCLRAFRQGLKDAGYVEGENVTIIYRWAENQINLVPELAAEFVRRQVAVIIALGGNAGALAVKAMTTTIPLLYDAFRVRKVRCGRDRKVGKGHQVRGHQGPMPHVP